MSSTAVPWQRLLTVEILQLPELRSSCHNRPCRILVNSLNCQLSTNCSAISSQPPLQSSAELPTLTSLSILLSAGLVSLLYSFGADPTESTDFNSFYIVGVFTDPLPRNYRFLIHQLDIRGRTSLFRGLCPSRGLYAAILSRVKRLDTGFGLVIAFIGRL
jgi:hypothetical protein